MIMRRLAANVGRSVLTSVVGVLLILVAVDALSDLFNEAEELAGSYGFAQSLVYIGMTIPARIYEYIPFACLIGCLIGLGALASNSELVVMRAAGVSLIRIVWFVLRPVLLVILVGTATAEYLVPVANQHAEVYKTLRKGGGQVQTSDADLWAKDRNEFLHINVVAPSNVLYGVTRYQFDANREIVEASHAERATYFDGYWQEENVAITRFDGDRTEVDSELLRRWDTDLSPAILGLSAADKATLSIADLHNYAQYLQAQDQDANPYWLEFWSKVLQPVSVLGLVLVAISFIFGPLRQVTMGFRIFSGVVLGIVFRITQEMLGPSSLVFGFSPIIAILVPVAICALIGLLLLRRAA